MVVTSRRKAEAIILATGLTLMLGFQNCGVDLMQTTPGASLTPDAPVDYTPTVLEINQYIRDGHTALANQCAACHITLIRGGLRFAGPASPFGPPENPQGNIADPAHQAIAIANLQLLAQNEFRMRVEGGTRYSSLRTYLAFGGHGGGAFAAEQTAPFTGCLNASGGFIDPRSTRPNSPFQPKSPGCQ